MDEASDSEGVSPIRPPLAAKDFLHHAAGIKKS